MNISSKARTQIQKIGTVDRKSIAASTLSLDLENWLNKNSRAAHAFKNEIDILQESLRRVDKNADVSHLLSQFEQLQAKAVAFEKTGQTFGEKWKHRMANLVTYFATFGSVYDMINIVRRGISDIISTDTAMTELYKVADAPKKDIDAYFKTAATSAKDLGSSVTDMVSATADWSRLGYNLPDSKELAEVATLYTNVGDGINIDDANKSLISTLRGFKLEASDAISIIDKFNEVSNKEPISSAGIGEALQRSAAAFNAANTSLSKSIALITGANSVIQDPEKVGTMWKTVSMRIRGAKAELEQAGEDTEGMVETTSQLRDLVKGMTGFDIMKDESTFKDIYEIVIGIGERWDSLKDIDRASLLEKLAGKLHGNALQGAFQNIDLIKKAYEEAENSSGSAIKEQERYEQSIQYSLDRLKGSTEEFWNSFINKESIKDIVDFGNSFLNVLTKIVDKFGTLPTLSMLAAPILGATGTG